MTFKLIIPFSILFYLFTNIQGTTSTIRLHPKGQHDSFLSSSSSSSSSSTSGGIYTAIATRLVTTPLVSPNNSIFTYNYNPTMWYDYIQNKYFLLVRCQNSTGGTYDIGPSVLAITTFTDTTFTQVLPLTLDSVIIQPSSSADQCGTEDPRITIYEPTSTLYLTYTAYTCGQPNLALATCPLTQSTNASAWTRHGTIFQNTKSAGILFSNSSVYNHTMYYNAGTVRLAYSTDTFNWMDSSDFLSPRPNPLFDSELIEGGPHPLPLSDGNLFYLYNSDNPGPNTRKPNWNTQYHCGFAILNGSNPSEVIQRSLLPLLSPELPWEMDEPGLLTPNVVFCEGLIPKPNSTIPNTFIFVYGAGDSYVGVGEITVTLPNNTMLGDYTTERLVANPILSNSMNSIYTYNYDPGLYVFTDDNNSTSYNMLVRVRNTTNNPFTDPYTVGPSIIAYSQLSVESNFTSCTSISNINNVLLPDNSIPYEACGVEDVRIAYSTLPDNNGIPLYYITYTAYDCTTARIMLATASNPSDITTWIKYGPIFINDLNTWSKSGALLIRPNNLPHYLYWGDNNDNLGIHVAISIDGITWDKTDSLFALVRNDGSGANFDANIIEVGSPPVPFTYNNQSYYIMIYSGAISSVPSPRPQWTAYYCLGYIIIDGNDPLNIIQRSYGDSPLMCPELPWETIGNTTLPMQYPNRIAINGLVPWSNTDNSETNEFLFVYGAGDGYTGSGKLTISSNDNSNNDNIERNIPISIPKPIFNVDIHLND